MQRAIKRVLVYTHNSIGMGHAFRTLAVITGIKHHRPDIDFLVLSGSSIPHLFLSHGIEVIKLPESHTPSLVRKQGFTPNVIEDLNNMQIDII